MLSTKIALSKSAIDSHNRGTGLPIEKQLLFMGNKVKTILVSPHSDDIAFSTTTTEKPKKIIRRSSIIVLDMGAENISKPLFESILVHKYGWSG